MTGEIGIAKLPVAAILISGDFSFEDKRQVTREQELVFDVIRPDDTEAHVIQAPIDPKDYSPLGQDIGDAEQGIIHTDHALSPARE